MTLRPYIVTVSEDQEADGTLDTLLEPSRVAATLIEHGQDPGEFWEERVAEAGANWRTLNAKPTLRELRDWLGY